jgi:hypothetical protein
MDAVRRHPVLSVIEGGGQRLPSWREVPSVVLGRSPFDRTKITSFRIATHDIQKALDNYRRQPLLDLWACVVGELPNFAGVERYAQQFADNRSSLSQSHACFQGLKRPIGDDDHGFDVIAFVTKPAMTFTYAPDFGCMIKPKAVPKDLIHVAYVQLDRVRAQSQSRSELADTGTVIHWEFVEADATETLLPIDFQTRYRRRRW